MNAHILPKTLPLWRVYQFDYSIARMGAERLWELLHTDEWVAGLGALTGNQAVQEVQAGMKAIYLSGW